MTSTKRAFICSTKAELTKSIKNANEIMTMTMKSGLGNESESMQKIIMLMMKELQYKELNGE